MTDRASLFQLRAAAGRAPLRADASALLPVVERLRQTIESENADIAGNRKVDYNSYSARKNQALLELKRLQPALAGAAPGEELRAALGELGAKLETNQRLLGVQLKAAKAVASLIARAIHEGQSDGTYSAHAW